MKTYIQYQKSNNNLNEQNIEVNPYKQIWKHSIQKRLMNRHSEKWVTAHTSIEVTAQIMRNHK